MRPADRGGGGQAAYHQSCRNVQGGHLEVVRSAVTVHCTAPETASGTLHVTSAGNEIVKFSYTATCDSDQHALLRW